MEVYFNDLKYLVKQNKISCICGLCGSCKTKTLLKLANDKSIFVSNNVNNDNINNMLKGLNIDKNFNFFNLNNILENEDKINELLSNKNIETIILDDINENFNEKEIKRLKKYI